MDHLYSLCPLTLDGSGGGEKKPPAEIRVFPYGTIQTLKGTIKFTQRSAQLVAAQWEKLGRDIGFDYEHDPFLQKDMPGKEKVSAGWGKVEVRKDGLWIVGIRWTPDATRMIAAGEFRYISPALDHDKAGEVIGLRNVALTNFPATLKPQPLTLSAPPTAMPETLADTQNTKHLALAKRLSMHCSKLAEAAQDAAGSDHPGLKALGAGLAEGMAQHLSALKMSFPELGEAGGDGGEKGDEEKEAEAKKMSALLSVIQQITGIQGYEGQAGALLALRAKAALQVDASVTAEEVERQQLLSTMLRPRSEGGTGQIHPADKALYEGLPLHELRAFASIAPHRGPKETDEVQGAVVLNGKPPQGADEPKTLSDQDLAQQGATLLGWGELPKPKTQGGQK